MNQVYKNQVRLLLQILPYVAQEKIFALKGGTAINMFIWDMPRLSVDLDLTYINFDKRDVINKLTKIFYLIQLITQVTKRSCRPIKELRFNFVNCKQLLTHLKLKTKSRSLAFAIWFPAFYSKAFTLMYIHNSLFLCIRYSIVKGW